MTVAELIARLKDFPQELPVYVDDDGRDIEVTFVTMYNRQLEYGGPAESFIYVY